MIFDYWLAGLVTMGLLVYLRPFQAPAVLARPFP